MAWLSREPFPVGFRTHESLFELGFGSADGAPEHTETNLVARLDEIWSDAVRLKRIERGTGVVVDFLI